ncbi:hypothetical protein [Variovorax sp. IB41]|uniref:hypothetical protein n=1 Tax=Variovorax sp. IB41 TaxID=2779370 RepID=UPI0018E7D259|nr:hypothetical protein [Variovorax sp. IB41]MBJ2155262.1 hypothetical protein [Variovorax sp. IB41]
MSLIARPDFFDDPATFTMDPLTNQRANSAPGGGSQQVVDRLNDRWSANLTLPARTHDDAAEVEAFRASMRGMTNWVDLYHLVRPEPRGTLRGTPTAQAAAKGAGVITINTTPGATLLAGDMVGVSGLLLQAQQKTVANGAGVLVLPIVNRLRFAIVGGAVVTWDRPSAPFRLIGGTPVQYVPGSTPEISFDFLEKIG